MEKITYQLLMYLIVLLPACSSGATLEQNENELNKVGSNSRILCKMSNYKGKTTCWSTQGCYVRQVYKYPSRKSTSISYDCIRDTEIFQHFLTCGVNYRRSRNTVFHYGMGKVRLISYCCGQDMCNNVIPTIPGENWIN